VGVQRVVPEPAVTPFGHQGGTAQDAQVTGHGRPADRADLTCDLARGGLIVVGQELQDLPPGGIRQRVEGFLSHGQRPCVEMRQCANTR